MFEHRENHERKPTPYQKKSKDTEVEWNMARCWVENESEMKRQRKYKNCQKPLQNSNRVKQTSVYEGGVAKNATTCTFFPSQKYAHCSYIK